MHNCFIRICNDLLKDFNKSLSEHEVLLNGLRRLEITYFGHSSLVSSILSINSEELAFEQ